VDVHPADINHVVSTPEDTPFQSSPGPTAPAGRRLTDDDVTGAVPNHRIRRTTQVRHDQLTSFSVGNLTIGREVQHFANVLTLVQMKKSRRFEAFETDRSDFGGTVMIDDARSPLLFNPLSCCWNAS